MLKTILAVYQEASPLVSEEGFEIEKLLELPVLQEVTKCKEIKADELEKYEKLIEKVTKDIGKLATTTGKED